MKDLNWYMRSTGWVTKALAVGMILGGCAIVLWIMILYGNWTARDLNWFLHTYTGAKKDLPTWLVWVYIVASNGFSFLINIIIEILKAVR